MRIATWNVNSITARLPRLLAWLERTGTDVLCVQETKCTAEAFPYEPLRALGYQAAVHATGRWNGVAVLSRVGLAECVTGLPGGPAFDGAEEPRAVCATCGPVRVWSVYVPNGREIGHPHYDYKLLWLDALRAAVGGGEGGGGPVRCAPRPRPPPPRAAPSPSWATSTSRRPTRTSGTRPGSRASPTSPPRSARRWPPCAKRACATCDPGR
jgi:hypothetical protein